MRSFDAPFHATRVSTFTSFARATFKGGWLIAFLVVGLWQTGGAVAVRGQSPLDGFDPNANGAVRAIVVQADGKILIGGDFTTLSPNGGVAVTRNHIARLNPDGTLDTAFDPNATDPILTGAVFAIALQADGKILIGGDFTTLSPNGGVPFTRNRIARLNPDGTVDAFNPNANVLVMAIAVQADGQILAGGNFTTIGGATRSRIARLDATTGSADLFDPNATDPGTGGAVRAIAVQADGKILAGGLFTNIGGQPRNHIARLETTGLADSFDPNANSFVLAIVVQADGKILVGGLFSTLAPNGGAAVTRSGIARMNPNGTLDTFNPSANGAVYAIALQADGKILAGGEFTTISGQTRNRIARLNADGTLDTGFVDPNANGGVLSIAVQQDGKILIGGFFFTEPPTPEGPNSVGGQTRNYIARLETDGRLDRTLDLNADGSTVMATAVQPDGKILIGGLFTTVLGVARNRIARLNTDGTLDTAFDPNANAGVFAIAVQADGKILVGGGFNTSLSPNSIGGQPRNRIARLNTDGTADSFNPDAFGSVLAIAVQADGQILAGGAFGIIGGESRNHIARLDATTGFADSFNPSAQDSVVSIAVQTDGKIVVGGNFNGANSIGGQTRNRIARLNTDGTADSFNPNANGVVWSIELQADGKVLAGGDFESLSPNGGAAVTRNYIARVNADGTLDTAFNPDAGNPAATGAVYSFGVQADGKIVVGGNFITIGGQTRNRIARLNTDGTADSFNPNAGGGGPVEVDAIALQADGKILAGGSFTNIGGQTRSLFARLSNDTAALQNLAVTQTNITWTRGGSSPQFTRVTFEYSDDNVNYTLLGNGTAAGSDWTRTGLSFTAGHNFYIRARGYYRSGYRNGSESITESVRSAFVAGPTAADATISGWILANDSSPIPGTIVNLSGTQTRKTITDASGNYRFDNVETTGFYTVTPWRANYSFGPASRSFSQLGNTTEAAFTGTPNSVMVGNSIDTPEYFVRQHYLDFLGREPEESGFNFWSDQLLECGADGGCLERRRINVSAAYFLSIEFQETGGLVDGLYRASYGRRPNYAEFMPDSSTIARGVIVGRTGWEQELETNKAAFVDAWVQRAAFIASYGNLSNDDYVDQLIAHTEVSYTASEREALVIGLTDGTLTRAAVLRQIVENQSFIREKFNQTFVMMQYFGYLRRDPDESGYQFWLNKLNEFNGNFEQAEMVKAFLVSGEYRQRFVSR